MSLVNTNRIHGLDVLRGVAMTLGVFLHGSIAYKQGYHYGEWIFDKNFTSYFFDWIYLWINSFRMQVFFLLAGFFARLLINRNGVPDFAVNRLKRVGLPLLISYFTILPLTLAPYLYVIYVQSGVPWLLLRDFYVRFFTFRERYGFMHLWFLQHLIVFYLLAGGAVIASKFLNIKFSIASRLKTNSYVFLLVTSLLLGGISMLFSTPLPSIWTGFVIPLPQFLYYVFFFSLGWILEGNREVFFSFKSSYKIFLAAGTVLSIGILYYLNVIVFNQETKVFLSPTSAEVALMKFFFAFETMFLVIGSIGMFSDLIQTPSAFWKYIADSAYWVYLIHMPLVMTFQLLLVDSSVPGILRFPIVIIGTLFFAFLSYNYLVRYTWVGTMLNGKREKPGTTPVGVKA